MRQYILSRPIPPKLAARLARELTMPTVLSAREVDCLALIGNGLTREEAAQQLHLSANTIAGYIASARMKLDARSQAHAVALAIIHGHLDPELISRRSGS